MENDEKYLKKYVLQKTVLNNRLLHKINFDTVMKMHNNT